MTRNNTAGMNRIPVFILTAIIVIASLIFAFALSGVKVAAAENSSLTGEAIAEVQEETTLEGNEVATESVEVGDPAAPASDSGALTPADDCKVTIKYLEYMGYDDEPDADIDEGGRRVLGTRVIEGLHEGDVLNAWNYVVDIPGHFFYDGWPQHLSVSRDPSKNTIDLIYMKLWNAEYTVNYYVMTGADLEADTWSEALAPDDVKFYKMGSETFQNHRFDELVKGDAYEYKLDDMYVIDTYPAEIRLGSDPDNNVINVLYTPDLTNLPDDVEIPDELLPPAEETPDVPGVGDGSNKPALPDDETLSKDDLITMLPDDIEVGSEEFDDLLGSDTDRGELEITDEMLSKPVNKEQAEQMIEAYKTGLHQGENLASTGESFPLLAVVSGSVALVAVIILVSYIVVSRKRSA